MCTGSCNVDLTLCRFLKVLLLECREGNICQIIHKQGKNERRSCSGSVQLLNESSGTTDEEGMTGKCPDRDSFRWEVCASHEYEVCDDDFSLEGCQNQLSVNPHLTCQPAFSLCLEFLGEGSWDGNVKVTCYWWKTSALQTAKESERNQERRTKRNRETCVCVCVCKMRENFEYQHLTVKERSYFS